MHGCLCSLGVPSQRVSICDNAAGKHNNKLLCYIYRTEVYNLSNLHSNVDEERQKQ